MKKLIFCFLLAASYSLGVRAQSELQLQFAPQVREALQQLQPVHLTPRQFHSLQGQAGKTAAIDSVSAHRYISLTEDGRLRIGDNNDPSCLVVGGPIEGIGGRINGTTGPIPVWTNAGDTFEIVFGEHGLLVDTPLDLQGRGIYVDRFFVFFDDCRQVGQPETYHLRMYRTQGTGLNIAQPFMEIPFNLAELPDLTDGGLTDIFEPPYRLEGRDPRREELMAARTRYAVMIEVNNPGANDTINLVYTSRDCNRVNPAEGRVVLYRVDEGQYQPIGVDEIARLFGVSPDANTFEAPFIVPIVYLDSKFVSRPNQQLLISNGMTLYDAFPNPASDHTHIRFDLEHNTEATIRVTDNLGRTVLETPVIQGRPGQNIYDLNVSELSCGKYSYIVKTPNGALGGRLLIDR